MSLSFVTGLLSIGIINIILSGDNAVVIAMASRTLPPRERRRAILLGGAGAIALRILFTAVASLLLNIPFLELVGGVLLVWIAYRLLKEDDSEQEIKAAASIWGAFQVILLADFLMSLDNILAIAGAAHDSMALLITGLVLSMPLILIGSSLIARLMNRLPWLSVAGAVILAITAARMVDDDEWVHEQFSGSSLHLLFVVGLSVVFSAAIIGMARMRSGQSNRPWLNA